ncbi:hypothetical protein ASG29_15895 [Sphingomonas sp. Leaf412]|uniref:helix-turn-helix transcriptional regulator n=1 Tax=Sphingomonas sp. Leaf412 TaxID=1736370 RepID=UPI0006F8223E|nr:LuxR C-terminal-related transcriptional regulator [Sphingomonas sp. Leaf412]KQT30988.1 hypothetical protein ASG29_15895 [Sphingomonas sp. Leaf412]
MYHSHSHALADHHVHDWRLGGPCVMIVDNRRMLSGASPAAHALLRAGDGLELRHGIVRPARDSEAAALGAAVRRVLDTGGPATATIRHDDDLATITLTLAPLDRDGSARVAIIADTDARDPATGAIARYGLTRAEGRVLALLCEGRSLPEAAAMLAIARTTARTHLQRIFDKTQARRQSDLVRLVLSA